MAVVLGRNSFVKLGEEGTWGTAVSRTVSNRIISTSLQRSQERNQTTFLSTGAAAFSQGFFDGNEVAGGTLEVPIYYEGSGMLIKAAMGSVNTTGSGPYFHGYAPATDLPSLTIELQRGSSEAEIFEGCIISSMTISVEAGSEMTASFEIMAQTAQTRAGSASATFGDGRQVLHYEAGQLNFNSVNYTLQSLELNLDNKIDRRDLLGSKLTAEPLITDIREVTLTVTLDLEDNNLYNAQIAGTQGTPDITFTNSDGDQFRVKLYNAVITEYSDELNTVGRIERTVTFQGLSSPANPAFEIIIANADSSAIAN